MSSVNLYVFRDKVSGKVGEIIECDNDQVMKRFVESKVNEVPYRSDLQIVRVGSKTVSDDGIPSVVGCDPDVIWRGDLE